MGAKSSKLNELSPELAEIWRTSRFTEEVVDWYEDFKRRYPTGQVSLEEFKKIYQDLCDVGDPDDFAAQIFQLYDVDKDGYLSFRELMCGMSLTSLQNPKDRILWIFKLYDHDENGFITQPEMIHILKAIFKMNPNPTLNLKLRNPLAPDELTPEKITARIYEIYDTDEDGKLTQDELIVIAQLDPMMSKILS